MSAARRSAAYTETPWTTGNRAVNHVMVSGAGRIVTLRSVSALAAWSTHRLRVETVRDGLGGGGQPGVAHALQRRRVAAQFGVQGAPVPDTEARPHDQRRPPLRQQARRQGGQRVGHLVHQRLGEPQVPVPAGESRLASATSPATLLPRFPAGTPASASAVLRRASSAAAALACPAAAADFSRSKSAIRAISTASSA